MNIKPGLKHTLTQRKQNILNKTTKECIKINCWNPNVQKEFQNHSNYQNCDYNQKINIFYGF